MNNVIIESILMELMLSESETVTCFQVENYLEANNVIAYVSNKHNLYQVKPRDLQFMFSHKGKTHAVKIVVMQHASDYYRICSNQFSHCFIQHGIDLETKARLVHRLRIFPCNAYEYFGETVRQLNTNDMKELYNAVMAKQEANKLLSIHNFKE